MVSWQRIWTGCGKNLEWVVFRSQYLNKLLLSYGWFCSPRTEKVQSWSTGKHSQKHHSDIKHLASVNIPWTMSFKIKKISRSFCTLAWWLSIHTFVWNMPPWNLIMTSAHYPSDVKKQQQKNFPFWRIVCPLTIYDL